MLDIGSSFALLRNSNHMSEMLQRVLQPECFSADVTLVCDDERTLKAHRIVLSAVSPVLKRLLNEDVSKSSVVFLKDFKYQEMDTLLDFLYLGSTQLDLARMNEFLNLAETLSITAIGKSLGIDCTKTDVDGPIKDGDIGGRKRNSENEKSLNSLDTSEVDKIHETDSKDLTNKQTIDEPKTKMKQCPECDDFFPSMLYMVKHYNSVHKAPAKLLCNQCAYQTTTKARLSTHIQTEHEGVKFNCNQCSNQLSSIWHLKRHVKEVHRNIKESFRFPCTFCDFKASAPARLRIHTLG